MFGYPHNMEKIINTGEGEERPHDVDYQMVLVDFLNELIFYMPELDDDRIESSDYCLGKRFVFLFPNGWMLTLPNDAPSVITHHTEEISEDNPMFKTIMGDIFDPEQWDYKKAINGWHRANFQAFEDEPSETITIINRLTALWGKPKLIIPLLDHIEKITDDEEHYLEKIEETKSSGETETASAQKLLLQAFKMLKEGSLQRHSPWEVATEYGSSYIASWSAAGRIYALASELEDSEKWFVSLDEHCGSCMSGTRKWFNESYPDRTEYDEFVTWGQSSEEEWFADGSTRVNIYVYGDALKNLTPYLVKYGFVAEEDLNNFDYNAEHIILEIDGYSSW
jgi:hypothetical protein